MLKRENRVDKERFDKLKDAEMERGREEERTTDVAGHQVKELRRREGRSKYNNTSNPR